MAEQLAFPFSLHIQWRFDNYFIGDNSQLIAQLQLAMQHRNERFFYIWAAQGFGKSHLLQACCHWSTERGQSAAYLPLRELYALGAEVLHDLEQLDLIVIDDIDMLCGDSVWQEALFHLYNRIREQQSVLIVAGENPLRCINLELADLVSRLSWGLVYELHDCDDEQKALIISQRASELGLQLNASVAQYLLTHYSRNLGDLTELLQRLDHASLSAARGLTLPFVKEVIKSIPK